MFWKDFEKICKSLGQYSKNSYKKLRKEFFKKVHFIIDNPYLYQCTELNKNNRRFIIQKYIVFYKIEKNSIIILRMLPQKINYNQKRIYKIKSQKQLELNTKK